MQNVTGATGIKIKFKKGVKFPNSQEVVSNLAVDSLTKRKAEQGNTLESQEHAAKRPKIETKEVGENTNGIIFNVDYQTINTPDSSIAIGAINQPSISGTATAANGTLTAKNVTTSTRITSIPSANLFKKLARHLTSQPALLEELRSYRDALNAQHREDAKTIAGLKTQIGAMIKNSGRQEKRMAEIEKADYEMIQFWIDTHAEECAHSLRLEEKIGQLAMEKERTMRDLLLQAEVELSGKGE